MSAATGEANAAERAASALIGYCMGAVVVLPFDRLNKMMQVAAQEQKRMSAVALAKQVLRTQGIRGLYQGGGPHMLIAPYTVLYYSIYGELVTYMPGDPLAPLWAATGARTLEVTARMPLELLRTQMQAAEGSVSLAGCVGAMWRQPFSAWFRGFVPTLLRDVPFSGIYWLSYEKAVVWLRLPEQWFSSRPGVRSFFQGCYCGAAAGMVAAFVTTPIDVVKTCKQHSLKVGEARGYMDIFRFIRDSPRAAFAGVGPRLIRIPLGMATMMSGIEFSKWCFQHRRERICAAQGVAPADPPARAS